MEMELQNESVYDSYHNQTSIMKCDSSQWEPTYIVIPALYTLIFILGLCGNGLVIFTVWRAKEERSTDDVNISNLAVADLYFVLTLPLHAVYYATHYHWPFGMAMCKIVNSMTLNMYTSALCLTRMGFDRYLASRDAEAKVSVPFLTATWLLSCLMHVPQLVFRTTKHDETVDQTSCTMDFSLVATDEDTETLWLAGLILCHSVMAFLLPFLATMACYCLAACTDKGKDRQRVTTALVVAFAVCWTPFHVLRSADALSYLDLAPATCAFLRFRLLAHPYATSLAYVNSCLNPILYLSLKKPDLPSCCRPNI